MRKRYRYRQVLNAHQAQLYGYALYFLRNRDDADDVVQETFIRLWNNWHEIDFDRVTGWLMKVNHNLCIDYARKRKMNIYRFSSIHSDPFFEIQDDVDSPTNPEYVYELTEIQKLLLDSLDTLPEQMKSIMLMHYFQGLKLTEISDILDLNLNTVKVTVLRGRKQLKEIMEKHFPEVTEVIS